MLGDFGRAGSAIRYFRFDLIATEGPRANFLKCVFLPGKKILQILAGQDRPKFAERWEHTPGLERPTLFCSSRRIRCSDCRRVRGSQQSLTPVITAREL